MLAKIKNFLRKHKDNFFVKKIYKIKQCINEKQSINYLKKQNKAVVKNRNIRVLFLIKDAFTWNKIKSLYFEMKKSNKFDVKIVCCPEPYKEDTSITYNFFINQGYDCIDARIGNGPWDAMKNIGEWFNLKQLKPDYVFYTEPYNLYLPKCYQTKVVSSYAKVCIIEYGFKTTQEFLEIMPKDFYRDVYLSYGNNVEETNYLKQQYEKTYKQNLQHFKYLGFLAYPDIFSQQNKQSPAWNFSKNKIRAIWTPRWTTDNTMGGTNFFKYKNFMFDYAKNNQDVDFIFRPHPMALDNFLRTGLMSKQEVDEFINRCQTEENLSLDTNPNYISTFWNSSFLITDISSIIVEYFVMNKPIIFCQVENVNQKFLPTFKKIIDTCYIVNNKEELQKTLNFLKQGNDPKKAEREKLFAEIFGDFSKQTAANILQDIINDAKGVNN